MQVNSYTQLIGKLDDFIRRYYTNQLIRGAIYSVGALVLFFIASTAIEYVGHLGTTGRTLLFYTYICAAAFILFRFILIPLLKLYKLGSVISHEKAADIIGKHFSDVRDKLVNTLQLHTQLDNSPENVSLITASIDQRIAELRPVPFAAAVDLNENKKYARYAAIPLAILLLLWLVFPSLITDSSRRILQYDIAFDPVAPFSFDINGKLETPAQQDFIMQVKMGGNELPDQVFLDIDGNKFKLNKDDKLNFTYTFKNVQRAVSFRLYADGFYSKEYELKALPNPVLTAFSINLDYPDYTGKKDELLKNTGDLVLPAGTKATWSFNTQNTNQLQMLFSDSTVNLVKKDNGMYTHTSRFLKDNRYKVITSNEFLRGKDQVEYAVSVVPDEYPSIAVDEKKDSVMSSNLFFKGEIEDDYGFKGLKFSFRQFNGEKSLDSKTVDVPFNKNFVNNTFFWNWNFSTLELNPGDEIEYWFEVWDNDAVNGSKSSRSQKRIFKVPTLDDIQQQQEENNEQVKANLKETLKDAKQLQKELDELNRRVLEKKEVNWQDKKKVQELIDKQQQIQQQVEEIKKENQLNNLKNEEFRKSDERMLEKQLELEKLLDQVLSEEMKEKLKELEKLMANLDKEKLKEAIDNMKQDNKDLEKELDRSLELFKQLEMEQKMNAAIEKLDELKEKQDKLSEKSEEKNADEQKLKEQQDQLNKEFEELRKDMDEMEKKNKELEEPMEMGDTDPMEEEIQKDMQKSSEELKDSKGGKASKAQKSASQKMKEMSDKMKQQQESNESESMEEDLGKLREILENLLQLSFDQERLMKELQHTSPSNPLYTKITADQKKIRDNAKMIEDSLFALSKRVAQLQSFINREISKINSELDKSIEFLAERQLPSAASRQQSVMTSVNNLALMLSEVSDQMQQQMAQQKPGSGECKKPGKNKKPGQGKPKPSLGTMRQLQQQLNEQMQQMKEGMNKPGGKGGKQGSEQLAKMAAQQEMLRNELQKMMNEMLKEGNSNAGNLRNIANKMEQTETDIVNKNISLETIRRQQEIMTRLLEAEKAERERELDDKRESNENKIEQSRNISEFKQYNEMMKQEAELLKTISPSLKPFYRNMIKEYFSTFN